MRIRQAFRELWVNKTNMLTAYHFWSPTCGPCKKIKPAVEELKSEFPGVTWIPVNTQDDREGYAIKYGVTVVPTIVVVSAQGTKIERHSGTQLAGYYRILRSN